MTPKDNNLTNENSQWLVDMDAEGSAITQEQIRDIYMAGTSDGILIRGQGKIESVPTASPKE